MPVLENRARIHKYEPGKNSRWNEGNIYGYFRTCLN